MKHPAIMSFIERSKWAITPEALSGILTSLEEGFSAEDYHRFHQMDKERKEALAANIGPGVVGTSYTHIAGSVGLLYLDGPIIPRGDMISNISGITNIETLVAEFKALESDPSISSIVLLFDTPGGNVVGVSEFSRMVRNSSKPTTSFVYGMAASAGYWIASAADTLVLADTGEVGSIGVVATYRDTSERDKKSGVATIEIVSSQSPLKRPDMSTTEGRASIQAVLDDLAAVFIDSVAEYRGSTPETVKNSFGQGAMSVGNRAVSLGMADSVGTLESVLAQLDTQAPKKRVYFSVNGPAADTRAAQKNTEETQKMMTPEEKTALESAQKQATDAAARVSALEAAAKTDVEAAVGAERQRIQSIEGLMGKFTTSSVAVRAAARKVVDDRKFDPSATAASVGLLLLDAIASAGSAEASAQAAGPRELAQIAQQIPDGAVAETTGDAQGNQEKATAVSLGQALAAQRK